MSAVTYTHDAAFAALCIMEEMIDPQAATMPKPWATYWQENGVSEMRELALELAPHCDAAWQKAYARYENDSAMEIDDPGSFDYDFVPIWLRFNVDWESERPQAKHPHVLAEHLAAQGTTMSEPQAEPVGLSDNSAPRGKLTCPSCGDSEHLITQHIKDNTNG